MKVVCNKAGECKDVVCCAKVAHDPSFYCTISCSKVSGAKCIPVEQYKPQAKPRRVRAFKEDVVKQNTLLEMRVRQLECELKAVKPKHRINYESLTIGIFTGIVLQIIVQSVCWVVTL